MRITVVGTGYVGLVTGACFTEMGNHVTCVDIDEAKLDSLRLGEIPIFEPGLDAVVKSGIDAGLLSFSSDIATSIKDAEYIFIAVGTPPGEDGSADLIIDISDKFKEEFKVLHGLKRFSKKAFNKFVIEALWAKLKNEKRTSK